MPRMKPPKGYISLREAEKLLNLSSAMIRRYVEQGRIQYLLPPGRHHGFYRRSDVERLAAELSAFLSLEEEEEEPAHFRQARPEDLLACIRLNRLLFPDAQRPASDEVLLRKWSQWLEKNPEVIHVLDRGGDIIGIVSVLPVVPGSPRLWAALREDISFVLGDVNLDASDVEEYTPGKHIDLYLMEIGISPTLPVSLRHRYGAKLISRFASFIIGLGLRGIFIDRILAVGATRAGIKLLQHFGFHEIIFDRQDTRLFVLSTKESGAPLMDSYRNALLEWQKTSGRRTDHQE
ncbi:MAG: hypothetical protein IRZ24_13295 [Thermogemmatispora sp.]|uniref:helix-turn-helix domain-containing protein n=1 Tax=Thermogemmatispora sp. TaxID=1968838 RepID=UPI001DCFF90D|nr:helix-turn-helix domain-containing protein [Thermogemmatispora sp.]MBX5451039.1 hypothetical protein [Thermogemmatispora sp.]